ncbi:muscarinic acetylcholine receptor M1-like [Asterias amurensis]|uniref:muscarinic acetylcholine receptor M1-like n=1 Tax=Asterias amurensis TaxID=7602 RepID=UPI003AB32923
MAMAGTKEEMSRPFYLLARQKLSTIIIFKLLSSFITVMGNLLILVAFCAERRLRTYTNYYIVGLSVADLVAGAFTMPMYTVYWVLGYWPLGDALCDTYLYVNHVFLHVSVLAILVLAFDRYQAVSQPLKHLQRRTLSHACYMIGIAYVVPILIWLPYVLIWPYITGSTKIAYSCIPFYVIESPFFSILAPIIFSWIPFPIITFLYWRIYLVIKSRKTQRRGPVMMQELSTSTSRVTVAEDTTPSNISVKVQPPKRQHTDDIADVNIILDNGNNQQELGQENPAFDLNEEEQYGNIQNNKTAPSVPNVSNVHPQRNQQPILDPNIQSKKPTSSNGTAQQQKQKTASTKKDRESRKESNRATRTLTLIFIVLMVASLPWSILVIIRCLCPTCLPFALYQTSVYIAHMNSTVNPFCYAIANPLYLDAFLNLVCCGRRTKRRDSRPSTRR